jgi:hypothetical protein
MSDAWDGWKYSRDEAREFSGNDGISQMIRTGDAIFSALDTECTLVTRLGRAPRLLEFHDGCIAGHVPPLRIFKCHLKAVRLNTEKWHIAIVTDIFPPLIHLILY